MASASNGIDPVTPLGSRLRARFETVRAAVRAVARGDAQIGMICGEPGLGKTETIRQEFKKLNIPLNRRSPINAGKFADVLYEASENDWPVLILDDSDVLLSQETTANVAKMAFEQPHLVLRDTIRASENERRRQEGLSSDPGRAPPRFTNRTRLIWLSNKNLADPNVARAHMRSDFQAICSRALRPIWVGARDRQELFEYTVWLGTEGNMLRRAGFRREIVEASVAWFIGNRNRIEVTPRSLKQIAELHKMTDEADRNSLLNDNLPEYDLEPTIRDIPVPKFIGPGRWDFGDGQFPSSSQNSPPPASRLDRVSFRKKSA